MADVVESFRDILAGLQDLYLSSISNRMNEVMKVLTIVATIFVPLTFVAGIYGMNFRAHAGAVLEMGVPVVLGLHRVGRRRHALAVQTQGLAVSGGGATGRRGG